ncbi:peroxiredoxin [Fulvivirga sedimenti]|uniref:thioredoxin-dependent peroxiredoxin n=1 Tax=Fulvivirga sedimenti TaxID=2879465 RepID=A0A9X1KUD9_9BACT|nr:peroxiredoxin [Fulvivirga sedimenti]MCA6073398.1 peroxiredoxin [Fulvivirga sedimenti]
MALTLRSKAPDFTLNSTSGEPFTLSKSAEGKPLILYFYPKDFTPGCTRQACSFRDHFDIFRDFEIDVYGISTDTVRQHLEFKEKHALPFDLLADLDGKVSKMYDARMPFVNVSKRITYLLDSDHRIAAVYSNLFGAEQHIKNMINEIREKS